MVSGINNIEQSTFLPQISQRQISTTNASFSLSSFDTEDNAIISSQATLLNELDKFNSGEGDAINLALACVVAKTTVAAEVNVIQTKKEMFDTILDMIE